jgi:predicted enzyme related to lactoylglutathione lyase
MARKQAKKKAARKGGKKRGARKVVAKRPARRTATRRPARKAAKRPARRRAPSANRPPAVRNGLITHTELASADPPATRAWCATVLGWQFGEAMPTPTGPYHMWRFSNDTGGGIRANNPPETPGSIPYCEVSSIQETWDLALRNGGTEMLAPQELPGGMGWIAVIAAPGGVPIGFWAMK